MTRSSTLASTPTRILVVDDHAVVRAGCRQLLERLDNVLVDEAGSAQDAMAMAKAFPPALVVLDINLPDRSGFDVIGDLLRLDPAIRILVFTMHEDPGHAARALAAGAHGFVTKADDPHVIVEAVRRVARGDLYLSQPVAQKFALSRLGQDQTDPLAALTRREHDVLRLLGQGNSLADVAGHLGVSYKTAANIATQIKRKCNLSTLADLIRLAIETDRGR